ncbi:MAG: hypothetical protein HeimC3_35000 [Candidatus Heimdallarchaeota archaeon LC_3]|nr:MAG: hypothetical protein HeimC3_35000 [Candidatus Heimdallarchaeota archaeon LC_3]
MLNFFNGGLHTAYFITNDIERTTEYYRDFLGLPLYLSTKNIQKDWKLYIFSVDKSFSIGFYEWKVFNPLPPKAPGAPVSGTWSFDHIMIGVEKEEDLWLLRDKYLMAGLEITEVVDHGFVYSIYTTDPINNISLEFAYQTYNLYNLPMFMDASPSAIADEGAFPKEKYWPILVKNPEFEKIISSEPSINIPKEYQLDQIQLSEDFRQFAYGTYFNRVQQEKLFFSFQANNHILFFSTNNLDETIKFYRDFLGFKLYNSFGDPYNQFKLYLFAVDESLSLAFFYWPTVKSIKKKNAGIPFYWWRWNSDSISFGVSSTEKLWLLYERFISIGMATSKLIYDGFSNSFEVFDPNNICIKFQSFTVDFSKKPLLFDPDNLDIDPFPQLGTWPTELDITPKGQRKVLPGAGWDLIPSEMKNAEIKVELKQEYEEEE